MRSTEKPLHTTDIKDDKLIILTSTVNRGKIYKSMEYDKENAHMLAY